MIEFITYLTNFNYLAATEGQALDLLTNAIEISKNTVASWNELWFITFQAQDSALWIALVKLGLILAGFSILYLSLIEGKEIIEKQSWSKLVTMLIWPIVIMFFLGNNGAVLASTVQLIRGIGHAQVQNVLEIQLAELTFKDAITNIALSNTAKEQIEALYSECKGLTGEALVECWSEKQESAEAIVAEAEAKNNGPLETLRGFVNVIKNLSILGIADYGEVFRSIHVPIIRFILRAVQWAFVNILEAALLLTAVFAPIAMGLSLLPLQGRPIFAWLIGMISLFGVQLGYNIIVGISAIVIVKSNAELASDIAFLFFLAIFAPGLAVLISSGGGIALYNGISSRTQQLANILSNAIASIATAVK